MISTTFYDRSINVLENPKQKHAKRNQLPENFSLKKYSRNSIRQQNTSCFGGFDGFYLFLYKNI